MSMHEDPLVAFLAAPENVADFFEIASLKLVVTRHLDRQFWHVLASVVRENLSEEERRAWVVDLPEAGVANPYSHKVVIGLAASPSLAFVAGYESASAYLGVHWRSVAPSRHEVDRSVIASLEAWAAKNRRRWKTSPNWPYGWLPLELDTASDGYLVEVAKRGATVQATAVAQSLLDLAREHQGAIDGINRKIAADSET